MSTTGQASTTSPGLAGTSLAIATFLTSGAFDEVEAADLLLCLGERPVGHETFSACVESDGECARPAVERLPFNEHAALAKGGVKADVLVHDRAALFRTQLQFCRFVTVEQQEVIHLPPPRVGFSL
jgi:hypothetical protein